MMTLPRVYEINRAEWITEWLRFLREAQRFGSKDPVAVANVLAGPEPAAEEK